MNCTMLFLLSSPAARIFIFNSYIDHPLLGVCYYINFVGLSFDVCGSFLKIICSVFIIVIVYNSRIVSSSDIAELYVIFIIHYFCINAQTLPHARPRRDGRKPQRYDNIHAPGD